MMVKNKFERVCCGLIIALSIITMSIIATGALRSASSILTFADANELVSRIESDIQSLESIAKRYYIDVSETEKMIELLNELNEKLSSNTFQ